MGCVLSHGIISFLTRTFWLFFFSAPQWHNSSNGALGITCNTRKEKEKRNQGRGGGGREWLMFLVEKLHINTTNFLTGKCGDQIVKTALKRMVLGNHSFWHLQCPIYIVSKLFDGKCILSTGKKYLSQCGRRQRSWKFVKTLEFTGPCLVFPVAELLHLGIIWKLKGLRFGSRPPCLQWLHRKIISTHKKISGWSHEVRDAHGAPIGSARQWYTSTLKGVVWSAVATKTAIPTLPAASSPVNRPLSKTSLSHCFFVYHTMNCKANWHLAKIRKKFRNQNAKCKPSPAFYSDKDKIAITKFTWVAVKVVPLAIKRQWSKPLAFVVEPTHRCRFTCDTTDDVLMPVPAPLRAYLSSCSCMLHPISTLVSLMSTSVVTAHLSLIGRCMMWNSVCSTVHIKPTLVPKPQVWLQVCGAGEVLKIFCTRKLMLWCNQLPEMIKKLRETNTTLFRLPRNISWVCKNGVIILRALCWHWTWCSGTL